MGIAIGLGLAPHNKPRTVVPEFKPPTDWTRQAREIKESAEKSKEPIKTKAVSK